MSRWQLVDEETLSVLPNEAPRDTPVPHPPGSLEYYKQLLEGQYVCYKEGPHWNGGKCVGFVQTVNTLYTHSDSGFSAIYLVGACHPETKRELSNGWDDPTYLRVWKPK